MTPSKRLPTMLAALAVATAPLAIAPAARAAGDPAASQIDSFDTALIDTMKQGPSLGIKGRYRKLEPVIQRTFDLPKMTQFAVGAPWKTFTPAQQSAAIEAFGKLTTASYAHNFNNWGGEKITLDANVQTRGPDKIVSTHLIRTHDAPVNLTYRMQQSGGTWKIIDVYTGSISQLTTRRSDFAASLNSGGAQGLISHLNTLVENQMK
jgi:phospholipid transport system substrate-binding protein